MAKYIRGLTLSLQRVKRWMAVAQPLDPLLYKVTPENVAKAMRSFDSISTSAEFGTPELYVSTSATFPDMVIRYDLAVDFIEPHTITEPISFKDDVAIDAGITITCNVGCVALTGEFDSLLATNSLTVEQAELYFDTNSGLYRTPLNASVSAVMTIGYMLPRGVWTRIKFNNVIYDTTGSYVPGDGLYRAPTPGVYHYLFTISADAQSWYEFEYVILRIASDDSFTRIYRESFFKIEGSSPPTAIEANQIEVSLYLPETSWTVGAYIQHNNSFTTYVSPLNTQLQITKIG